MMKGKLILLTGILVAMVGASCAHRPAGARQVEDSPFVPAGYKLVWHDEFDSEAKALPDTAKWKYQLGGGGWGNRELQYYAPAVLGQDTVAFVEDGVLNIVALKPVAPVDGHNYLSARMNSKQSWTYGYFEAGLKMPVGRGTWPAFWMLPQDMKSWPLDGEIDIMEHVGSHPDSILVTVHTQKYNHSIGTQKGVHVMTPNTQGEFHIYAMEWTAEGIKGFVDGKQCFFYPNEGTGKEVWPFDVPFYLLLNQAVGGGLGGLKGVDDACVPATYQVDYVRVYQK